MEAAEIVMTMTMTTMTITTMTSTTASIAYHPVLRMGLPPPPPSPAAFLGTHHEITDG